MSRALVLCLMICVSVSPVLPGSAEDVIPEQNAENAQKPSPKELRRQAALREKLELMGSGAQIRVVMRGTNPPITMEGAIEEIAAENFALKTKDRIQKLQYSQIEKVALRKGSYKGRGESDPVRVRQVAADMGIGENARIKLKTGGSLNGRILTIDENSLTIMETKMGQPKAVAYSEMIELHRKKFPAWGKVAIVAGVVVGLLAGLVYAACGSAGCH